MSKYVEHATVESVGPTVLNPSTFAPKRNIILNVEISYYAQQDGHGSFAEDQKEFRESVAKIVGDALLEGCKAERETVMKEVPKEEPIVEILKDVVNLIPDYSGKEEIKNKIKDLQSSTRTEDSKCKEVAEFVEDEYECDSRKANSCQTDHLLGTKSNGRGYFKTLYMTEEMAKDLATALNIGRKLRLKKEQENETEEISGDGGKQG